MRPLLVLAAALVLVPAALAQEHGHETGDGVVAVLHDGPDDGRAVVGGLTHFGFALLDHDGAPLVHRDANFTVVQAGRVVFSTEDTHEYDGVFSFDVTFTRPGPYTVVARSEEMVVGLFSGVVVPADAARATSVLFEPQAQGPGSSGFGGTLAVVDESGALVPHSDLLAELRRAGDERLVARFHLHVHREPAAFTLAAPPGEYALHVTGYEAFPTGEAGDVRPSVASFPVSLGAVPLASPPPLPMAVPGALKQSMGKAEGAAATLHAMVDPQNQVGVGQPLRIAGVVVDADARPLAHVDFELTLRGPRGLVFASQSLHEYDGVLEHLAVPDAPGVYEATLTAIVDEERLTVPVQFQAVPPAAPIAGAGVGIVTVQGLDAVQAGVPTELTFHVGGPQGPVQHSEVDVTLYHEGEAPVYQFKLHTHASGDTRATVVLPHEGGWVLRVDPLPTLPQAVVFQSPAGPDAPIAFGFDVAAADALDDLPVGVANAPQRTVPGAGLAALVAAAALALLMLPRQE